MAYPPRKIGFILASTDHGTLIVNRFDYRMVDATSGFGVGYSLLENSGYEVHEGSVAMQLLTVRRQHFGDGVVAVDCGANIGVHTVEWAKGMTGWGFVVAIEPQERIYYALAGNLAINNCFNAHAINAAVGAQDGSLRIPVPNYLAPASFRLDLIKIDVERMELEVLQGAKATIERFRPIVIVEQLKAPKEEIAAVLASYGYERFALGLNFLAVHPGDPTRRSINVAPPGTAA